MLVYIKSNRRNQHLFIDIDPQDTVLNLKEKIYEKWRIPVALQRIIVSRGILNNTQPLAPLNLQYEEVIYLIERISANSFEDQVQQDIQQALDLSLKKNTTLYKFADQEAGLLRAFIDMTIACISEDLAPNEWEGFLKRFEKFIETINSNSQTTAISLDTQDNISEMFEYLRRAIDNPDEILRGLPELIKKEEAQKLIKRDLLPKKLRDLEAIYKCSELDIYQLTWDELHSNMKGVFSDSTHNIREQLCAGLTAGDYWTNITPDQRKAIYTEIASGETVESLAFSASRQRSMTEKTPKKEPGTGYNGTDELEDDFKIFLTTSNLFNRTVYEIEKMTGERSNMTEVWMNMDQKDKKRLRADFNQTRSTAPPVSSLFTNTVEERTNNSYRSSNSRLN